MLQVAECMTVQCATWPLVEGLMRKDLVDATKKMMKEGGFVVNPVFSVLMDNAIHAATI